jgi:hypothetical protein
MGRAIASAVTASTDVEQGIGLAAAEMTNTPTGG